MEAAVRQQSEQSTRPESRANSAPPTQEVKTQAEDAWRAMKDIARARTGETQQEAARGLGHFADALRHAAHEVEDARHATTAHVARTAAGALESASARLREMEPAAIVREAEGFARRQPLVFFGAAVAAGFLAVRFVKSSGDHEDTPPPALVDTR